MPVVVRPIEIVACSVGGLRSEGLVEIAPFRARTAAMLAAVAPTCAKGVLTRAEVLYLSLVPEDIGS